MVERTVPKNGFTAKFLDNLKSEPERFEISDAGAKGLRLRVSPGGTKTFVWYYRDGGRCRRLTLGQYGDGDSQITLAQARSKLIAVRQKWADGIKPNSDAAGTPKTVAELCAERDEFYKAGLMPEELVLADSVTLREENILLSDFLDRLKHSAGAVVATGSSGFAPLAMQDQ